MSAPAPDRDRALVVAVVVALVAGLLCGPVLRAPTRYALGSPCSEAPQHLWSLWLVTEQLFTHGPLVRRADIAFPGSFVEHLMDPANLLLFAPVHGLGGGGPGAATLAWNALHVGMVIIGGVGAARLARRLAPGTAAAAVLVAGFVGGSALLGHPDAGRSEYLPALWLPLHLAWLHEAVETGRARASVLAGVALALVALGGAYVALFSLPVVVVAALAWGRGVGWGRRLRGLGPAAAIGGLAAAVAAWATLQWPPFGVFSRLDGGTGIALSQPLAALWRGGAGLPGAETTMYPGLVLCGLALTGLALRPRRAAPWVAVGAVLVALGLGPTPFLGDSTLTGPTSWLVALVPPLAAIQGWPRLGFVAPLPLAIAAAIGAAAVLERWGRALPQSVVGLALAALLLADQATFPRHTIARWPGRLMDAHQPADVTALLTDLPAGALLHSPYDNPLTGVTCPLYGRYQLWSLQHERPITMVEGPAGDSMVERSWVAAWVAADVPAASLPLESGACAAADAAALRDLGIVAIVQHDDDPRAPGSTGTLVTLLGEPTARRGDHALWRTDELAGPPAAGCLMPAVRRR